MATPAEQCKEQKKPLNNLFADKARKENGEMKEIAMGDGERRAFQQAR